MAATNKYGGKVISLVGNTTDKPATAETVGTTFTDIQAKKIWAWDGTTWVDITTIATYTV